MDTSILERNLENICKLNANLCKSLKNVKGLTNEIDLTQNGNGQFNLLYNSQFIHNNTDPEQEARTIFQSINSNTHNTIHVIFGLGLGYLFNEFCESAKGKIILFEPSMEIFRAVLDFVDFSKELNRPDVFLVNNLESLQKAFFYNYLSGTQVNFVFLDFYKNNFGETLEAMYKELIHLKTLADVQVTVQKTQGEGFITSALQNLETKIFIPPLANYKDLFKNKPAIIVSAGPSLNNEIETIKKYRDKAVIFAVGTAYKTLVKNGIKPDFLNIIEAKNVSAQISGLETSSVNFISEPYTNDSFFKADFKRRFFTCSNENIANLWFAKLQKINCGDYETKGTVSYNALFSAKILGCNPIILVGQDLAYADGKLYADGSIYSSLKIEEDKDGKPKITAKSMKEYCKKYTSDCTPTNYTKEQLDALAKSDLTQMNKEITTILSQDGKMIPTSAHYALFVMYFEDFAKRYGKQIKLFNTSAHGAKIKGFKYKPLEELLAPVKNSINVEDILKAQQSFVIPEFSRVIGDLEKESYVLTRVITMMQNQMTHVKNFEREIVRYKRLTVKANEHLKKALDTFIDIITNYQPESKIVEIVTYDKKTDLAFVIKEYDGSYDYKTQMILSQKLFEYYTSVRNLEKIKELLDQKIEAVKSIYENINSKS